MKQYFDVVGLNTELIQANVASVYWEDFRGDMDLISTYYGDLNREKDAKKFYTFSLIPTASACSCLPNGHNGSEVGIDSLTFTTTYDYNADYPAGADISDILEFSNYGSTYQSYEAFIAANDETILFERQSFHLKEAPEVTNTPLQLTINLTLDNGELYEFTTEGINLTL